MPRAIWKGFIKLAELSCPVALYAAASTSERVSFHTINRKTGNRVHRRYVDEETGEPVEKEDQTKGYETEKGQYVVVEPEEIAAAIPPSDKTICVEAFVARDDFDTAFLDRPYFLAPDGAVAQKPYAVIREGMKAADAAAIGQAVLFRKARSLVIRPQGIGLVANTLKFEYEVRQSAAIFDDIPDLKIKGEMLQLARHIIETKQGKFDPAAFDDRYDAALRELVQAKIEGRQVKAARPARQEKIVDLMQALRESARAAGGSGRARGKAGARRKAG